MTLRALPARLLLALGTAPLLLGATAALPAQASTPTPVETRQPRCDSTTTYTLNKKQGWTWYAFDSGTIVNRSKKATLHKTVSHSSTESRSTTKSGEVGLSVKAWVVEINGKYGYSVSKSVSYTSSQTFTVDVPPRTTVSYKDGIIVRKFRVKIVHVSSDCRTTTSYGHVWAADNRSEVRDV